MEVTVAQATAQRHPPGLYVLFATEMWERFSYYGMRAILILYLGAAAAKGGLGLSDIDAGAIYGIYTASVYLLSLPGGWLADNVLGQRKAIRLGAFIIMLGHILLALPDSYGVFFVGLSVVAVGTGLLKPNISSIVGELYPEGGARRDAAFSIFYMGINLGGALGMLTVGYLGEKVGWHWGFGAAAVAMMLALLVFGGLEGRYLKPYGLLKAKPAQGIKNPADGRLALLMAGVLAIFVTLLHLTHRIDLATAPGLANGMGIIIVSVTVFYFIYILITGKLSREERQRVGVMAIFFVAAALFWAGYEQGGSTLNTFSLRHTNRFIGSWEFPASWLQFFQSAVVIGLAPLFAALWLMLGRNKANPSAPIKFGLGLIILGLGFLVMYFAAQHVVGGSKVGMSWLISTYVLSVAGEMCLSPVGLSFYTKLAPARFVSQFMGIWFVAASLGNLIAGIFSGGFDEKNVQQMPALFLFVVAFTAGSGLLMLLFNKPIRKWMNGIE